ncbi:MAG: tetratricopeptide repeat protein [Candidatus Eremiobacterota bacterium]
MRLLTPLAMLALLWILTVPVRAENGNPLMEGPMASFYAQKWDESILGFESVLERDEQNTLAMAFLLDAYYKKRDINGIINKIEQKAVSGGDSPILQSHLGMAYFLRGRIMPNVLEEALSEFKQALKDDPTQAIGHTGMGLVYFQKRMMPRAKGYFIKALRLNPHDVMAMEQLGNILLVDEKKPEDALQLFQRIIAELPTYPDGYYYVGSSYYDLQQYDQAVAHLHKAVELDPNGVTMGFDSMCLLGDTYLKLGRNQEALVAYEQGRKVHPDSQYLEIKIKKAKEGLK